MAYAAKHFDKASYRTYCLMGDGESMEGNIWEALNFAGFYKLNNLCAIIDVNRLGQSDPAPLQHDMEVYRKRLESFGFHALVVDGHDIPELCKAFQEAESVTDKHTCLIAKTFKGKNFAFSQEMLKVDANRYIECFICEQNMLGVGIGVACRDRTVAFASTFAAFLTRGFDNLRMGVISQTNLNVVGSHCGVSIGEDGPSQMALEDLAMFRSLPGCTVFYPSDAVATERAVEVAANTKGICFIRVTRPNTPVIYANDEKFQIGKAKVVRSSPNDQVLVIGGGITLLQATEAADQLAEKGINIRVMDPFTIKPLDVAAVREAAAACGGRIVTVEDHYPEGGIGDAVLEATADIRNVVVKKLAVNAVPRSGPPMELLEMFGISASSIVRAVTDIIKM